MEYPAAVVAPGIEANKPTVACDLASVKAAAVHNQVASPKVIVRRRSGETRRPGEPSRRELGGVNGDLMGRSFPTKFGQVKDEAPATIRS
jgi:hypothetical protein